eukprot:scaffold1501_cov352-Pavlova_lutheri.AAC.50
MLPAAHHARSHGKDGELLLGIRPRSVRHLILHDVRICARGSLAEEEEEDQLQTSQQRPEPIRHRDEVIADGHAVPEPEQPVQSAQYAQGQVQGCRALGPYDVQHRGEWERVVAHEAEVGQRSEEYPLIFFAVDVIGHQQAGDHGHAVEGPGVHFDGQLPTAAGQAVSHEGEEEPQHEPGQIGEEDEEVVLMEGVRQPEPAVVGDGRVRERIELSQFLGVPGLEDRHEW